MAATRTRDDGDSWKESFKLANSVVQHGIAALICTLSHHSWEVIENFRFARLIKTFLDGEGEMKYEALHNPQCIAERLFGTFLYIQYTHTHTHKQKQNSAK